MQNTQSARLSDDKRAAGLGSREVNNANVITAGGAMRVVSAFSRSVTTLFNFGYITQSRYLEGPHSL